MITAIKDRAKRHWPRLRLRTIVFATLFIVAALPGFGAIFLRVYENTLVRQTEAELVAQGAALVAAAAATWPAAQPGRPLLPASAASSRSSEPLRTSIPVDLSTTPIRRERPAPAPVATISPDAVAAADRLGPVLSETGAATLASIVLLDRYGHIAGGTTARGSYAALPEVAIALTGAPATLLRRNAAYRAVYRFEWLSRAAAIRVHHARPIRVDGRVVGVVLLSRSARSLFKGLYEDRGKILLGIATILGLLVVLSGVLSRGITRPIERLSAATRAVAGGRGSVPDVPPTAAIEIQGLYADFKAMGTAIERRSRYLRDIAHAISHEFKTPLAGIRGAIELLQDHAHAMTGVDRQRFLSNAASDADRLAQLITRLLDLARADMTQAAPEASVDLPILLTRIADAYADNDFAIELLVPGPLAPISIPAAAMETVFVTLVENSRQAGARIVKISATNQLSSTTIVRVEDDGAGILSADAPRLFEPFFTTKRAAGGTGLGLTIARSLLEAHGGAVAVMARQSGAAFEVVLPTQTADEI